MTLTTGRNTDYSTAVSLLKKVYHPRVEDFVPEIEKISKFCEFSEQQKIGDEYWMPVTLGREGGFTFNSDGTAFQLNKPISAVELTAKVTSNEFVGRSVISYAMLNRAMSGGGAATSAGRRAFVQATKHKMEQLIKGGSFARELQLMYGGGASQLGYLGKVSATTGSSGTTLVVTMDAADWATAIWAGSTNLEFDIYAANGTKRNSSGSGATSVYKVSGAITPGSYKVTFTSDATNVSNVVAGDLIYFAGSYQKEMLGIAGVFGTSGTLWNISNSDYNLWKPRTLAVGGQLTFEAVIDGIQQLADIGFNGTVKVWCSNATWKDMIDDQAALVRHAEMKGGKVSMGASSISYYAQTGSVEIEPHMYMHRGRAWALPQGKCSRVGSTDLTFDMPGSDGKMVRHLEDYAGLEIRTYYDQAFFCECPAYMLEFTGISNSSD